LSVKFGLHRFVSGVLLNVWFIIAIGLPASYFPRKNARWESPVGAVTLETSPITVAPVCGKSALGR
jgi:hypothetical protein